MTEHDRTRLGPYVLGGLDPAEHREVADHVANCPECQAEVAEFEELKEFLGEVPPEAFLDGPPEGGDLMLQRTLQAVRAEAETHPTDRASSDIAPAFTGPASGTPSVTGPPVPGSASATPPVAGSPVTGPRVPGSASTTPPDAGSPVSGPPVPGSAPASPSVAGSPGAGPGSDGPGASRAGAHPHPGALTRDHPGQGAPARHPSGDSAPPPRPSEPARASSGGRRVWLAAAAAVVLIGGVLAGGIAIGRQTVDPVVTTPQPTLAPGSREVTTTDPVSRVTMATTVEPRQDWSYVHVKLTGVPAGSECELIVTDKAGKGWIAGSWIIGEKGAREGARFGGGVVVPADQVTSVQLKTLEGKVLASTRF